MNTAGPVTRCGHVAIIGRPNVGKSTLVNRILGQKIAITSRKPQTTRHRLLGIHTREDCQVLYVDTPGIHEGGRRALNRYMNRAAASVVTDVDVVLFVIEGVRFTAGDEWALAMLREVRCPVVLVLNKVDALADKNAMLPFIDGLRHRRDFAALVPVSARTGAAVDELERVVDSLLPVGPMLFPPEQVTDRSQRFLAAEIIREKLTRLLGDELPHELTVQIDEFDVASAEAAGGGGRQRVTIDATVFVERSGQKGIVIGRGGGRLKRVASEARQDLEQMLEIQVMLNVWVKVRSGWSDDERALRSLGYRDG